MEVLDFDVISEEYNQKILDLEKKNDELKKQEIDIRPLRADEIECRVVTVKEKYYVVVLYKNARVDMKILDETFGVLGWERSHEVINGNLFCNIKIYDKVNKQWITKQDVGTESFTEKQKGEASDSFKRAATNIGIGRELYTAPFLKVNAKDQKEIYNKDKEAKYAKWTTKTKLNVKEIGYNSNNEISKLILQETYGKVRYEFDSTSLERTPSGKGIAMITPVILDFIKEETENQLDVLESILHHYKVRNLDELSLDMAKDCMKILKAKKEPKK